MKNPVVKGAVIGLVVGTLLSLIYILTKYDCSVCRFQSIKVSALIIIETTILSTGIGAIIHVAKGRLR